MTDKEKIKAIIQQYANKGEILLEESYAKGEHASTTGYWDGYTDCAKLLLKEIDSSQEEPVSKELEDAVNAYIGYAPDIDECSSVYGKRQAFKAGAKWQKEQFEKNRLKHCNSITNEQAELEQGFIDQHLDKYHRMPTFLDAIEYGMNLQKEQMIKNAVDGVVAESAGGDGWVNIATGFVKSEDVNVKFGDKIKIIVVKED